jgi:hypothetical protein
VIGFEELSRRFTYHQPDAARARQHANVRTWILEVATLLDEELPDGREKSLAVTHLEEATFWANAALARPPSDYVFQHSHEPSSPEPSSPEPAT